MADEGFALRRPHALEHHAMGRTLSAWRVIPIIALVALTTSCATPRFSMGPAIDFSVEDDLKALSEKVGPYGKLDDYYKATTEDTKRGARDQFITARLAIYNLRYLQFIAELGADKQQLDAATDLFQLGLNLTSTLTGGIRAKTNLSALSAGITGGKASIDKHFYFDQTVRALIAAMNAQRKQVLVRILTGMQNSTQPYGITEALSDLHDYYQAGTLLGAIDAIQSDATKKDADASAKIPRMIGRITESDIDKKSKVNAAISRLGRDPASLPQVVQAVQFLKPDPKYAETDFNKAFAELWALFRERTRSADGVDDVTQALQRAGIATQ